MTAHDEKHMGLLEQIREDKRVNGSWTTPGFQAMAVHRFGAWRRNLPRLLQPPATLLYYMMNMVVRNVYGIEIASTTTIGRRFRIAHQSGIVIHYRAQIGDDCVIRQNVTIGAGVAHEVPRLGHRVSVGAGAVIIGDVTIGDDARIGPNAVVMTNVPPGAMVVATPARIVVPTQESQASAPFERATPAEETAGPEEAAQAAESAPVRAQTDDAGKPKASLEDLIHLIQTTLQIDMPIDEDTPLISSGLIDSLQVVVLLAALEERYGVSIEAEQVDADTFDTPEQILAMIERGPQ